MKRNPARALRRYRKTRTALHRAVEAGKDDQESIARMFETARLSELLLIKAKRYLADEEQCAAKSAHEKAQLARQIENLDSEATRISSMTLDEYLVHCEKSAIIRGPTGPLLSRRISQPHRSASRSMDKERDNTAVPESPRRPTLIVPSRILASAALAVGVFHVWDLAVERSGGTTGVSRASTICDDQNGQIGGLGSIFWATFGF